MGQQTHRRMNTSLGKINPKLGQLPLLTESGRVSSDVLAFLRERYSITTMEEFYWAVTNGLNKPPMCKPAEWNIMVGLAQKRCKKDAKQKIPKIPVLGAIAKAASYCQLDSYREPIPVANLDELFKR